MAEARLELKRLFDVIKWKLVSFLNLIECNYIGQMYSETFPTVPIPPVVCLIIILRRGAPLMNPFQIHGRDIKKNEKLAPLRSHIYMRSLPAREMLELADRLYFT